MADDDRMTRFIDTLDAAEMIVDRLREDRAKALTATDVRHWFTREPKSQWDLYPGPDVQRTFDVLAKLACPVPCVGYVNETGWHRECERKAQEAMRALGLHPPDLTPIPTRPAAEEEKP